MAHDETLITTDRLMLRSWRDSDLADFIRLHADPQTMSDYRGPIDADQSRAKLADYRAAYQLHGYIRWRLSDKSDRFLGYVGIYPNDADHPLGAHGDIGWRLIPDAWGQGYATEAARAVLVHHFQHHDVPEVLAYTQAENLKSQAVIARLPFQRDPSRDFTIIDEIAGEWRGMVWSTRKSQSADAPDRPHPKE